ncbi:hypothetical protein E2C01_086991 [Portunus trituberculatus]|uniref:Uncharacterized protein n=1 Tax=Portunus trituberculatus TaxID=210409 RepID=A0A5B7JCV8_PORTR|nr:hypothetical protein [Portunus trituberculatus]
MVTRGGWREETGGGGWVGLVEDGREEGRARGGTGEARGRTGGEEINSLDSVANDMIDPGNNLAKHRTSAPK